MSTIQQRIGEARRRLTGNIFLNQLCLGVLVAAGLWVLTILVGRLCGLGLPLGHGSWVGALVALGVAGVATLMTRPSPLRAALALDAAAGLKERLSTALVIEQSADPFARAALQDAERTAGRVHVPSHIRRETPALWPWSTAVAAVALLLLWLMPSTNIFAREKEDPGPELQKMAAKERAAIETEVSQELNKIKELAKDNPALKAVAEDLKPLDVPETPANTPEDVRRQAIKRVEEVGAKLKRELEKSELNALSEMKRMMNQLDAQSASNSKLEQSLASGDFKAAKQALQQMADELKEAASKADDPQAQAKLEQLQQQLARLSEEMAKLDNTLQIQKELESKGGLSAEEAKKLADKLSKMDPKQLEKELQRVLGNKANQQQIQQMAKKIQQSQQAKQAAQKMANALSKACQGCKQCQGNNPGSAAGAANAAQALSEMADQLSDLEMAEQMMAELEAQLSDLDKLSSRIGEGQCDGQGQGERMSDQIGSQGPQYGLGMGEKIGKETTPYKRDPTKAKTRYDSAKVIGQYLFSGPQVGGQASAEAVSAGMAAIRDAQDAVDREEIPRQYEPVAKEYFERLAGLLKARNGGAAKEAAPAPAGKPAPAPGGDE